MAIGLRLIKKIPEGGNAWSFVFLPNEPMQWIAGQFIRVELPHAYPDEGGIWRDFTIASAPHEGVVRIATRITDSSFKQALMRLPMDGEMRLVHESAGMFIWQEHSRPLVFAAQGIGITPFVSMLRQRVHEGQPVVAQLFFTNLVPEIPFEKEIRDLEKDHPGLEVSFLRERFSAERLMGLVPDLAERMVYVSGPDFMMELLQPPYNVPAAQFRQDSFPNYSRTMY